MSVCRQLKASRHTLAKIVHERNRIAGVPNTDQIADRKLSFGIHRDPSPNIAVSEILALRLGNILLLASGKTPNLIALNALRCYASNISIMIIETRFASVFQQFRDRILADPCHSHDRADAVTFDYHSEDLRAALPRELV